jgi:hypothetical protein
MFNFRNFLVGRGLATSYLETPPNSPNSNQEESELINTDDRKTSTSPSDDDSHRSTSLAFSSVVKMPSVNRPTSASMINASAFKAMSISGNICPRCSKTVYSAEEVKAAGKVKQFKFFHYESQILFYSHFINDVILVLIVKEVSVVVDIQNVMVNFMITVG